mmetsp:Transcript_1827/g.3693  ORF Transcript_1827/g.3693 Transcript_1827/m.3693 type:complete len:84 (-) Transcript_1827:728-979(-)
MAAFFLPHSFNNRGSNDRGANCLTHHISPNRLTDHQSTHNSANSFAGNSDSDSFAHRLSHHANSNCLPYAMGDESARFLKAPG